MSKTAQRLVQFMIMLLPYLAALLVPFLLLGTQWGWRVIVAMTLLLLAALIVQIVPSLPGGTAMVRMIRTFLRLSNKESLLDGFVFVSVRRVMRPPMFTWWDQTVVWLTLPIYVVAIECLCFIWPRDVVIYNMGGTRTRQGE